MHRAVTLPSHKLEKRKEIKYIKTALKKNSYPSRILCSRKKTKAEITDSPRSSKGYVIIPYFPGLSETRKNEHIRDIRNAQSKPANIKDNTTALCKHAINLHHNIDWNNSQILEFETNYRKRRFIESFFINNVPNTINDRKSISLLSLYFKLEN